MKIRLYLCVNKKEKYYGKGKRDYRGYGTRVCKRNH